MTPPSSSLPSQGSQAESLDQVSPPGATSAPDPQGSPSSTLTITVNGQARVVEGASTHLTLLGWLRKEGLTGTKEGCAEGDCGACSVVLIDKDMTGRVAYRSVNACIGLLPMFAGREVLTVEGLADGGLSVSNGTPALHPVQAEMVKCNGSQCGFCTPGFVMSMFEGYYRADVDSPAKIHDQLQGNLCRCTGYRPIRDAMTNALATRNADAPATTTDLFALRLGKHLPATPGLHYASRVSQHELATVEPSSANQGSSVPVERFLRPTTLEGLLKLRAAHPDAVVVAGATELGVFVNKRFDHYPLLLSTEAVPELRKIDKSEDEIAVFGGATLTDLEEALQNEFPAIDKMLYAFASRQIRNRATVAGNIVNASPIGDLPPLLLALDATVTLTRWQDGAVMRREVPLADFFVGYRKTVLEKAEILECVRFARRGLAHTRKFESYKVSKRRELDISIVAAAFCVDLDEQNVIVKARLAFGGVAATPIRAKKTEGLLLGRVWEPGLYESVASTLSQESTPLSDTRSGKEFRAGLVTSLFAKFVAGVESEAQDPYPEFAAAPLASSQPDSSRSLFHDSAVGHVTGRALYVEDEASRRGNVLRLWPVRSPHAHAIITSLDVSAAQREKGVALVLTGNDIPGDNDIGAVRKDEPLLATKEVAYHGQMVAVVVADTLENARKAAEKVVVTYEALPAVLGIEAAIAAESFHTSPHRISRGDAHAAMEQAPQRLSGALHIGGQEHFYLEAQAAWAEVLDDGSIFVSSSTQHPSEVQAVVSHVLHIPRHRVVVSAPRMGGGFGGKETQGNGYAALVALASLKTGKPVAVQLDRDLDMVMTGKRHPFFGQWSVGFDDEGKVLGVSAKIFSDGGYALDLSESILDRALFHFDNAYYLPAVSIEGRVCKTNVCSHTAFRGFGGPQGMIVIEEILDHVARHLGLPPELVRERNLYRGQGETNTTHYGQHLEGNRLDRIVPELLASSNFAERRQEVAQFNRENAHVKRGLCWTPVKFGISFTASFLNQAGALVLLYRDGSAQVNHGGTEMGQGLHAKMLGVAMRELGLSERNVRVMKTSTDKIPNTSATAASSGADLNGAAVKNACETLKSRLGPVAAQLLKERFGKSFSGEDLLFEGGQVFSKIFPELAIPFADVTEAAYFAQVPLSATGFYRTPNVQYDKVKGTGRPFHYFAYGACVAEVEVDEFSGMKKVRRVDILHDVGDSLNPAIDRGQVEGAFVQGMGWLTAEELKWDDKGRLLTHSASTYQIPAIGDAPADFRVALLRDARQDQVIHGSKAVGEPPLMLAIAVREALRDAVAAFGKGGRVLLPSPVTHEALYHAIQRQLHAD